MRRTIISLWVVSLCACSAGPSGPYEYTAPAVNLHVRLADLPAGNVAHAWLTAYLLEEDSGSLSQQQTGSAFTPVSAGDVDFQLVEAGARATIGSLPDLRFFQIFVGLSDSTASYDGYPGNWGQPGLLFAYAVRPTSWSLFGPASQSVTFPQGYSWLRRTCALQPGEVEMEVRPVDEVVELRPMDSAVVNGTLDAQASEKSFLASCGWAPPTADFGTRVSFDRGQSLVWSPDNASIYYLSLADPQDSTATVGLRQVRLADSSTFELATLPHGGGLQIDTAGRLFVWNQDHLLRSPPAPTTPTTLESLPLPPGASVSPDGRWIAYPGPPGDPSLHIWDVAAGVDLAAVDGSFAGWSPGSQLAYWPYSSSQSGLTIFSPTEPGGNPRTYPHPYANPESVVWTSSGPLIAKMPFDWPAAKNMSCGGCFGLSLVDPVTGSEQPVLNASAGLVFLASPRATLDFVFVWTKSCLGLLDTVCSYTLSRVNLTDASVSTITTSPGWVPMAISSDGRHLAFSTPNGIYEKDLP